MSIELLELAADTLGELLADVVFVGGATVTLWITDPAAPPIRPTKDVDVVVEVATRTAFYHFEDRLRSRGFTEDQEDGVICRWRHPGGLILDAMPADPTILGFSNRWQGAAIPHAMARELPSGTVIRAMPPPYLLATKLEAFNRRGNRDFLGSRDFADIIALVDGREELGAEVMQAPSDARAYISHELTALLSDPRFADGLFGALRPDTAGQARAEAIIMPRLRSLTGRASHQGEA